MSGAPQPGFERKKHSAVASAGRAARDAEPGPHDDREGAVSRAECAGAAGEDLDADYDDGDPAAGACYAACGRLWVHGLCFDRPEGAAAAL